MPREKWRSFESIEDVAGVRIICLYRSDLEKIETLVRDKFDVVWAKTLRNQERNRFGYMSDHYVVRIPKDFKGERYDTIKSLKGEIQIRTVSMHAWATVSHHLDYKQEVDVPSILRDDFIALSGVFRIADALFEQFRGARERSVKTLMETVKQDQFNLDEELNLDTLKAYLSWKFPDRERGWDTDISALLSDIHTLDIDSFRTLDNKLNENMKWFELYEKKNPLVTFKGMDEGRFQDVGVARVILRERLSHGKL